MSTTFQLLRGTAIRRRRPAGVFVTARWGATLLIAILILTLARSSESGGIPETIPTDWVTVTPGTGAEIVQFIQRLPQDANPLGVRAAHLRTKAPPATFRAVRFSSADGTPLAGILGLHGDATPRPGVVLVPGFTQTTGHKFIVELADLLQRNGWQVLAIDLRGHGVSRTLSPALITGGWKEAADVLGAVRFLRAIPQTTSVTAIGFSDGGRTLVKAMESDGGTEIAAGIAVTAALGPTTPETPPTPGSPPAPLNQFFLNFLGGLSTYEYYERAARSYGVDLRTMEARTVADTDLGQVKTPLLLLYALDDFLWLNHLKQGEHDGGSMSLAYRARVVSHPNIRTVLVDRGNHAGMLYLSGSALVRPRRDELPQVLAGPRQGLRDNGGPPLDILAEGTLAGQAATYRFLVRNHGPTAVGPMDLSIDLPAGARLSHCWLGGEGLGRCTNDGARLTWTLPRLSGGKTTAGPFGVVVDVSTLPLGRFEATASIDLPTIQLAAARQEVWLEKK